jgi:parallel beta-helix repeat protein
LQIRAMLRDSKIVELAVFWILLFLLYSFNVVSAQGGIIIDGEGSIDDDRLIIFHEGVYYLTGNVAARTIIVQINDVILDGNGYMLQGSSSPGSIGIELNDLRNVTIRNFKIIDHDIGLSLKSSENNFIYNNTFRGNNFAVAADREGRGNKFYNNNFIDQRVAVSSTNTWYYDRGGNYWSHIEKEDNYSGPYQSELGSDGFSDRPYYIDEYNIDNFPLMEQIVLPDHKEFDDGVDPVTGYELIILISGSGTTDPSPGTYRLKEGETVNITSTPDEGWKFDRWLLYGSEFTVNSSIKVTMSADKRLEAVFIEEPSEPNLLGLAGVVVAVLALWYFLKIMKTNRDARSEGK